MIENTISEIEAKIADAKSVSPERKAELLKLLGTLKTEVATLSKTHGEEADSIANFARVSAVEATRSTKNEQLREISNQGLLSSVDGFEKSHPKLVQIVNTISKMLSDLGI